MLAEQALRSKDMNKAQRLTGMSRQAYDSILRLTLRMNLSGEAQSVQFKKDVEALKASLLKLGERV